uniref:Uncharacterized protein n=1 Tax=Steinernema glaseri TaxID=37863 RepID=A0A1I7Z9Z9_9BILA
MVRVRSRSMVGRGRSRRLATRRPVGRPECVKSNELTFDALEEEVDLYLDASFTLGHTTLKSTLVNAIDNFFRMIVHPTEQWTSDFQSIDKVDRIRLKIVQMMELFCHRSTVVNAFVNGFRKVLSTFRNGRMDRTDREWPFVKVLLTRIVASVSNEGVLCALGKVLSTLLSQAMTQGTRQVMTDFDVQFVTEVMTFMKSAGTRIGRNRAEGISNSARRETKTVAYDFEVKKEHKEEVKSEHPSEAGSGDESDVTAPLLED